MNSYKTDQQHLVHRGREFHFVSYEAHPGNPRTGDPPMPATWFLMCAGKRRPVMVQTPNEDPTRLFAALTHWLDGNVFTTRPA